MSGFNSLEEHAMEYINIFEMLQHKEPEETTEFFDENKSLIYSREETSEIFLPCVYIRKQLELTETEYWLMMLAYCCELEQGICVDFMRKYQEKWPNIQYALHLMSSVLPVDFNVIAGFVNRKHVLWDLFDLNTEFNEDIRQGVLMSPFILNRQAFYFLMTGDLLGVDWCRIVLAEDGWDMPDDKILPLHEKELNVLCRYIESESPFKILLHGDKGSGKHTLLYRACHAKGVNALYINVKKMTDNEDVIRDGELRTLRLLCRLLNPLVILEQADKPENLSMLITGSLKNSSLVIMTDTNEAAGKAEKYTQIWLELKSMLSYEEKKLSLENWIKPLKYQDWQLGLLDRYRLNIGELQDKFKSVKLWADTEQVSVESTKAWEHGLRERKNFSNLGKIIENNWCLDDIVLPEDCRKQLETVMELAECWRGGQGLLILFHGSSGTGKTMSASIIANSLRLPLFKVDLSQMFDKYIGETEKHIDEVFRTAQRNHYMLFLDEADALFSKRTQIRDSHDKYANVSTSYLLQRIEEYDGTLILSTNLLNHFDDAFVRRIRFVIKFRKLDADERKLLWNKSFEGSIPVSEDVSFDKLAKSAELSPARIRAAAQVAMLLAERDKSGYIRKEHLRKALELEAVKDETKIERF